MLLHASSNLRTFIDLERIAAELYERETRSRHTNCHDVRAMGRLLRRPCRTSHSYKTCHVGSKHAWDTLLPSRLQPTPHLLRHVLLRHSIGYVTYRIGPGHGSDACAAPTLGRGSRSISENASSGRTMTLQSCPTRGPRWPPVGDVKTVDLAIHEVLRACRISEGSRFDGRWAIT